MIQRTKINMNGNIVIEDKIKNAIKLLKHYEPEEGYYFANSGGKDSEVVRDLLIKSKVKFDAHHNLTTVGTPEQIYHIRENHPETTIDKPLITMWQLIVDNVYPPTRIARYCCAELKERGGENRFKVTGIRKFESNSRAKNRKEIELCYKDQTKTLNPIYYWSESDVWNYIKENELTYCKLYNCGYSRVGCILCPFKKPADKKRDIKRYPKHYQSYLRAFKKMLEEREKRGLITNNWKTPEEVMEWWINKSGESIANGQTNITN